MAAPFAHEDLEKLKKFIEFVSANPLVLTMPELDFVKKFIEKFGGTVPAGNFQMPAGGDKKCPFGGDAKPETKSAPEPEAEEESEESELELDTTETIVPLVEPNVLYLDVKPPKIARTSRAPPTRRTKTKSTKSQAKKISKKSKVTAPVAVTVKKELQTADGNNEEDSLAANDDPLYMPNVEVKIEIEVGEAEVNLGEKSLVDCSATNAGAFEKANFSSDEMEDEEQDEEEYEVESKSDEEEVTEDSNASDDEDEDEEDELLIMLTKHKVKTPRTFKCHETCKQRCTQRFTDDERLRTCELFWSMSKEARLQFIRSHTKQKRHARLMLLKFPTRSNHCCYFFDSMDCKTRGDDLIRVCRKFFETTLCISSYIVKKALNGYTPEPVCKVKPLTDQEKEARKKAVYEAVLAKKSQETQEILDPETGYLVAPNAKKDRLKKKNSRRKPGDPQPKRNPKPIHCEIRCIYKCHIRFDAAEREQICDHFWSLDYKRRKEFVLAHIETKGVLSQTMPEFRLTNRPPRTYQTRFYLDSEMNTERRRVCKDFLMATLCITRHFITNALDYVDKNTGTYIGSDGRGKSSAKNRGNPPYWDGVMEHISSYATWVPYDESKLRYLHSHLTIKLMHKDYEDMCQAQQMKAASINGYYKVFHKEFHLSFLCIPKRRRGIGLILLNPNISQYTGNEPGGYWIDPSGKKMDLSRQGNLDLTKSFLNYPRLAVEQQTATSSLNLTMKAASTKWESKPNNTNSP